MSLRPLIPAALVLAAACSTNPPQAPLSAAAHAQPVSRVATGDPVHGRRAFLDLHCNACHRVAEDPSLPRTAVAAEGPLLHDLGRETPETVGWKIVTRTELDPEAIFDSPMTDAASAMTERQLVDLIAYLRDPAAGQPR